MLEPLLTTRCQYRRLGSGLLLLALAAEGATDGFYEARMKPWDALAGLLLVREAGGITNDYEGLGDFVRAEPVLALAPGLWDPFIAATGAALPVFERSEEHTSELQSLMRISYAVFCLKKK